MQQRMDDGESFLCCFWDFSRLSTLRTENSSQVMNVKAKGYMLGTIAAATYWMNPLFAFLFV